MKTCKICQIPIADKYEFCLTHRPVTVSPEEHFIPRELTEDFMNDIVEKRKQMFNDWESRNLNDFGNVW